MLLSVSCSVKGKSNLVKRASWQERRVYDSAEASLVAKKEDIPFSHPLIAGSKLRYRVSSKTSPSLRSDSFRRGFCLIVNVSPGIMVDFGRLARTTDVYVCGAMMCDCELVCK